MPNDMSPIAPANTVDLLSRRTHRYCDRAKELTQDPSLTMADAARALDHMADLQHDLADMRTHETSDLRAEIWRIEARIKRLEASLTHARSEVSEALLRAIPSDDKTEANLYGPVSHGMQPDDAIIQTGDTKPTPPQAISASRALLDLEALRPYLSEVALREAIERHAKESGRYNVCGVAYARVPASAHLPCFVF